jgi:tight adherence protein B
VSTEVQLYGVLGVLLAVIGGTVAAAMVLTNPRSTPRRIFDDYVRFLDGYVRFLLLRRSALSIARIQLAVVGAAVVGAVTLDGRFSYAAFLALILPPVILRRQARKRRERIEQQLDGWMVLLANMLKATGALGEALTATVRLSTPPISQEVELVAKEIELGSSLDVALRNMAERIGSSIVSTAVTGLLVARQTGGDLPKLLETSAAALRELARLEGVVRSKTAQAKLQLLVMGLFPPGIYYGLLALDPHFFDALTGVIGILVYGFSVICWISAMLMARKILDVDV